MISARWQNDYLQLTFVIQPRAAGARGCGVSDQFKNFAVMCKSCKPSDEKEVGWLLPWDRRSTLFSINGSVLKTIIKRIKLPPPALSEVYRWGWLGRTHHRAVPRAPVSPDASATPCIPFHEAAVGLGADESHQCNPTHHLHFSVRRGGRGWTPPSERPLSVSNVCQRSWKSIDCIKQRLWLTWALWRFSASICSSSINTVVSSSCLRR